MASSRELLRVHLRLYVTGRTPAAAEALAAVQALQQTLGAACVVDVIDVLDDPGAALRDGIYATPTVVRVRPAPARRIFGRITAESLREDLQLDDSGSRIAG
jgi:circadian clock protein KaiB